MIEPVFKIEKISKSYSGHVVLKDVSFEIMPSEILGIMGASGSGKTTLLNTIIGFVQPEQGDVLFRLNHLLTFKNTSIYRSVYQKQSIVKTIYGFASQVPSFYEELTVKENLEYFGILHNLSKDAINSNTETLLSLMNLQYATNIQAKNLSGGMKRRLDIACSLIHDPDVLILDEPTADLDPIHRHQIWNLIKKINSKGTTIILSSHHLTELDNLCDRVALIKENKIFALDSPENLKKQFVRQQEIILRTKSEKYDSLIKKLKGKYIEHTRVSNNFLHIYSTNIEKTLMDIIEDIQNSKEELEFIEVTKSSLDDVFINIVKKDEFEEKIKKEK
ncbi:MAG: ABC transporter ATP-binding protein [Candidatus Woesearchaeota archaeon]